MFLLLLLLFYTMDKGNTFSNALSGYSSSSSQNILYKCLSLTLSLSLILFQKQYIFYTFYIIIMILSVFFNKK